MSIVTVLTAVGLVAGVAASLTPDADAHPQPAHTASAPPPVFACRLGALTPVERAQQKELRATLLQGTTRVADDAEGFTFHFAADVPPATVIAWVQMERRCCPFLRFTLDVPEEDGPSRLRVWGAPGAKAFVAAEMKNSG